MTEVLAKRKMACIEVFSDNFYIKSETSLSYFILKTVGFFCRILYVPQYSTLHKITFKLVKKTSKQLKYRKLQNF
jgi:hypothetical protein